MKACHSFICVYFLDYPRRFRSRVLSSFVGLGLLLGRARVVWPWRFSRGRLIEVFMRLVLTWWWLRGLQSGLDGTPDGGRPGYSQPWMRSSKWVLGLKSGTGSVVAIAWCVAVRRLATYWSTIACQGMVRGSSRRAAPDGFRNMWSLEAFGWYCRLAVRGSDWGGGGLLRLLA